MKISGGGGSSLTAHRVEAHTGKTPIVLHREKEIPIPIFVASIRHQW